MLRLYPRRGCSYHLSSSSSVTNCHFSRCRMWTQLNSPVNFQQQNRNDSVYISYVDTVMLRETLAYSWEETSRENLNINIIISCQILNYLVDEAWYLHILVFKPLGLQIFCFIFFIPLYILLFGCMYNLICICHTSQRYNIRWNRKVE